MAKSNSVVSVNKSDLKKVTVTVTGFEPIVLDLTNLTGEIRAIATQHGITQKLVDSAALSRDTATGKPATPSEKHAAILDMAQQLNAGVWNAEREGGATSILFAALCAMLSDQSPESIRETLDGMTDAEKRALPLDPEVAPFYKAERDARDAKRGAGVDTKNVLARFKS